MVAVQYSLAVMLCLAIQIMIISRVIKAGLAQTDQKLLYVTSVSGIAFTLSDFFWAQVNFGTFFDTSIAANYAVNGLYCTFLGVTTFCWFLYGEYVQQTVVFKKRKNMIVMCIPIAFIVLMPIVSYSTGWLFYIDENNNYHRGPLYFLQFLMIYLYLFTVTVGALLRARQKKNYAQRHRYYTLASFALFPMLAGIVQIFTPLAPMHCIGMTMSFLLVYIANAKEGISTDALTGLNNRVSLMNHLDKNMGGKGEKTLYFLMIDVDYFKLVNDRYGHVEGDEALIHIADVMRRVCAYNNAFAARFGGDEFVAVIECESERQVWEFCQTVHKEIHKVNQKHNLPYTLSLSIGYAAEPHEKTISIPELMEMADKSLYESKKSRKNDPAMWR